jgi:hypothetical protein
MLPTRWAPRKDRERQTILILGIVVSLIPFLLPMSLGKRLLLFGALSLGAGCFFFWVTSQYATLWDLLRARLAYGSRGRRFSRGSAQVAAERPGKPPPVPVAAVSAPKHMLWGALALFLLAAANLGLYLFSGPIASLASKSSVPADESAYRPILDAGALSDGVAYQRTTFTATSYGELVVDLVARELRYPVAPGDVYILVLSPLQLLSAEGVYVEGSFRYLFGPSPAGATRWLAPVQGRTAYGRLVCGDTPVSKAYWLSADSQSVQFLDELQSACAQGNADYAFRLDVPFEGLAWLVVEGELQGLAVGNRTSEPNGEKEDGP